MSGNWTRLLGVRERPLRQPVEGDEGVARWLPLEEPRDGLVEWGFDRVRDTIVKT